MRISDWSSDVCSSDLWLVAFNVINVHNQFVRTVLNAIDRITEPLLRPIRRFMPDLGGIDFSPMVLILVLIVIQRLLRSEEHTSELQSLMRISYAVFCLKKKKLHTHNRK